MKTFLKYGIFTGLAVIFWLLISFILIRFLGVSPMISRALSGLFSILILVLGIILGLRETKKKNDGQLNYRIAVFTGIKISLITAFIVSIYSLLYCTVIHPGIAEVMAGATEKMLRGAGASPEEITAKISEVRREFSAPMQVIQSLIGQSLIGTIASLIIGLFIRTK